MKKIKADIFDYPEIRELTKDASFDESLNPIELSAWLALKLVIVTFLGNHRSSEYQKMVDELMKEFRKLGAPMSVEIHFFCVLIWITSLRTVETSAKSRVSAFTKIFVV